MDLWIRSQDKEILILASHLDIYHVDKNVYAIEESGVDLGNYKSKERALEVLNTIESCIQTNSGFDLYSRTGIYPNDYNKKWNYVPVYEMPKE